MHLEMQAFNLVIITSSKLWGNWALLGLLPNYGTTTLLKKKVTIYTNFTKIL